MAQHLGDLPEMGSPVEHPAGQSVAKEMRRNLLWSRNLRLGHGPARDVSDAGRTGQGHSWCDCAQEDPPRWPNATVQLQIAHDEPYESVAIEATVAFNSIGLSLC